MVLRLRLKKTGGIESTKIRLDEVPNHPAISAAILLLRCLAELSFLAEAKLRALSFFPKEIIEKGGALLCFKEQTMQAEECFAKP